MSTRALPDMYALSQSTICMPSALGPAALKLLAYLLPSKAMHQRVLYCDISDITNRSTDNYLSVLGR